MIVQAEVSLYPLRTEQLGRPIDNFIRSIKTSSVELKMGTMSTQISGEIGEVFSALSNAFGNVTAQCEAVLVMKVSNACPACVEPAAGIVSSKTTRNDP